MSEFWVLQQVIKYGVVRMQDLAWDVLTWERFYLSGRLQKPVCQCLNCAGFISFVCLFNLLSLLTCSHRKLFFAHYIRMSVSFISGGFDSIHPCLNSLRFIYL